MTPQEITERLRSIASAKDFPARSGVLTDAWEQSAAGLDAVDSILEFMEENPDVDYGTPGALVHFVERFYRKGYDEKLVESVRRKPTHNTVWMLNRLINGAKTREARQQLVRVMEQARLDPRTDQITRQELDFFLD
jgi:hypothetical protein